VKKATNTALIYVSLGENLSPTLADFSQMAGERLSAECFLITDRPELWGSQFPGRVKKYRSSDRFDVLRRLRTFYPGKSLANGGFWMATLERIFALAEAADWLDPNTEVVHFESDVMSLLLPGDLDVLRANCGILGVPAESQNAGCASLLYAPSVAALTQGLENLAAIIKRERSWFTDMQLLAAGIQEGVVKELPTLPQEAWELVQQDAKNTKTEKFIFDATALGMFLFGADSIHTGGTVSRGYRQQDFDWDVFVGSWAIRKTFNGGAERLVFENEIGDSIVIANLHVHSKINPGRLSSTNQVWMNAINESRLGFVDLPEVVSDDRQPRRFVGRLVGFSKLPLFSAFAILSGKALRFLCRWK
jgi:hypothetical protein